MNRKHESFDWVRDEFSGRSFITKEQFCRIAKVSKRTALYYLQSGLLPCECTGKTTHKYKISIDAAIAFLEDRAIHPARYHVVVGWYSGSTGEIVRNRNIAKTKLYDKEIAISQLATVLNDYPPLLDSWAMSDLTGFSRTTVNKWCKKYKGSLPLMRGKEIISDLTSKFRH